MRSMNSHVSDRTLGKVESAALDLSGGRDLREDSATFCWEVAQCTREQREACTAFIERRNCWEVWEASPAGESGKGCCHPLIDCHRCVLVAGRWTAQLPSYLALCRRVRARHAAPANQVCEHFYLTTLGGEQVAGTQDPKEMLGEERHIFRCRLRAGTHLATGFVMDVCLHEYNVGCVFRPADE